MDEQTDINTLKRELEIARSQIEQYARAAKIEAALEEVRASSLAMRHTSELQEVINTVGRQFRSLEINNTGGVFVIINEELDHDLHVWGFGDTATYSRKVHIRAIDRPIHTHLLNAIKNSRGFLAEAYSKEEKVEYFKHLFKHPPYNETSREHQNQWLNRSGGYTRSGFISDHTTLFMINHHGVPFSEEENQILIRFAHVFEQSYIRFLDLKKAEDQTREAQTEAALERVRTKALGMHQSEELVNVIWIIFKELVSLGMELDGCFIQIDQENSKAFNVWLATPDRMFEEAIEVRFIENPIFTNYWLARSTKQDVIVDSFPKKTKDEFYEHVFTNTISTITSAERKLKIFRSPGLNRVFAITNHGGLMTFNFGAGSFSDYQSRLVVRFATVFEQAYTRFLDLKKAEAQAREAQLEAALERIRSRSLAMHKSTELTEVSTLLFKELLSFCNDIQSSGIVLCDREQPEQWMCSYDLKMLPPIHIPKDLDPPIQNLYKAWEAQQEFFVESLNKEEAQKHSEKMMDLPEIKAIFKNVPPYEIKKTNAQTNYAATFKQGYLLVITDFPVDSLTILPRFAKVFEQTYTRFLDLKKAEAQTRESEIQLALERVRARTMAMHQSEELNEVVGVLYEQIGSLHLADVGCNINIFKEELHAIESWMAAFDGISFPDCYYIEGTGHPFLTRQWDQWRKQAAPFHISSAGEELKRYGKYIIEETDLKRIPDEIKEMMLSVPEAHFTFINFKYGQLEIVNSVKAPSQESIQILTRFIKVFEQAYTRFLDLKKAEAQAREAQIEAALERIRARTMAMHSSDEFRETIGTLFDQLNLLGFDIQQCSLTIVDEEKEEVESWQSASVQSVLPMSFKVRFTQDPYFKDKLKASLIKKEGYSVIEFEGNEKKQFDKYLFENTPLKEAPSEVIDFMKSHHKIVLCRAFMRFGFIEVVSNTARLDLDKELILQRFSRVFEQTYRRFLDLQKAEEQAKEAQIEASLERVRSRALAMHSTSEISEVLGKIFVELTLLGMELNRAIIWLINEEDNSSQWISLNPELPGHARSYQMPYLDHRFYNAYVEAYKSREFKWEYHLYGEEKAGYDQLILSKTELSQLPENIKMGMRSNKDVHIAGAFNDYGGLITSSLTPPSDEQYRILLRFSKVFEQSYTRFLDLQKAEAQAREAQIEAALERVRAASMAMHQSEDLSKVALAFFKQIEELEIPINSAAINLINESKETYRLYFANRHEIGITSELAIKDLWFARESYRRLQEGEKEFTKTVEGDKLKVWIEFIKKEISVERGIQLEEMGLTKSHIHTIQFHELSNTIFSAISPLSDTTTKVLKRMTQAFGMSYVRFLDLQKAEERAREAQIEAALERVRTASMIMQHSDQLPDVAVCLLDQFEELAIPSMGVSITLINQEDWSFQSYFADNTLSGSRKLLTTPIMPHDTFWMSRESIQRYLQGEKELSYEAEGTRIEEWIAWVEKYLSKERAMRIRKLNLKKVYFHSVCYHDYNNLVFSSLQPMQPEFWSIVRRLAHTFGQSYRRFLDLQKAEAQAREAQIEAALERVRSKSLAMRKATDLTQVISTIYKELGNLQVELIRCLIFTTDLEKSIDKWWMANSEDRENPIELSIKHIDLPANNSVIEAWKLKKSRYVVILEGEEKKEWDRRMLTETELSTLPENVKEGMRSPSKTYVNISFNNYGGLSFVSIEPLPDQQFHIITRFAKVFNQAYARFLDLQKAEAQAREAQIEAALERVRARTMAMHESEELGEVVQKLFQQMHPFGLAQWGFAIRIALENGSGFSNWVYTPGQQMIKHNFIVPNTGHWVLERSWQIYKDQIEFESISVDGQDKEEMDATILIENNLDRIPRRIRNSITDFKFVRYSCSAMKYGLLVAIDIKEPSGDEDYSILNRFAKVFEQTYTRFLDLKKAEDQTRTAQIEAALERVRARALAMHSSDQLPEVSRVLREQMAAIGQQQLETIAIHFITDDSPKFTAWFAFHPPGAKEGTIELGSVEFSKTDTHYAREFIRLYKSDPSDYLIDAQGEHLKEWQVMLLEYVPAFKKLWANHSIPDHQYWYFSDFSGGNLMLITLEEASHEALELLRRSATVFDLAYRRYLDLKKSEELAKETIKQASLDRLRAEIASMRSTQDLMQITPLIWDELQKLEIPFIRCGVFIIDEEKGISHTYLSTPKGESIAVLHLPLKGISLTEKALIAWKAKNLYTEVWDKDYFRAWSLELIEKGYIHSREDYEAGSAPEFLHLHFLPFKQGMLYIGNTESLSQEHLDLGQSMANSFSIAYDRYEDFRKLEEAKQKIEQAFTKLESAQSQLIHAEKMASLGELTAGIAHEIQNPLNFVNNFSEIGVELVEEIKAELKGNDLLAVEEIIPELTQNLEKIHHHGERASAIVKGMLDHSRANSNEKSLTDINQLCDEYLRLSYHGLRAKNKLFQANFRLDADPNLPKIHVVSQDIGRVLLNLINNGFQATLEKSNKENKDYKPLLKITTKKHLNNIVIHVLDNGPGIPAEIQEKIFQPFFTTKPTGQGTGLGLSLAYDIMKAHGGEIRVNSESGQGTEFTLLLPLHK